MSAPNAPNVIFQAPSAPTGAPVVPINSEMYDYDDYDDGQVHVSPIFIFFSFLKQSICSGSPDFEYFWSYLINFIIALCQVGTIFLEGPEWKWFRFWTFMISLIVIWRHASDYFSPWSDDLESFYVLRIIFFIIELVYIYYWFNYLWIWISNTAFSWMDMFPDRDYDFYEQGVYNYNIYSRYTWKYSLSALGIGQVYFCVVGLSILPSIAVFYGAVHGVVVINILFSLKAALDSSTASGDFWYYILTSLYYIANTISFLVCCFLYSTGTYGTEVVSAWLLSLCWIFQVFFIVYYALKKDDVYDCISSDYKDTYVVGFVQSIVWMAQSFMVMVYYYSKSFDYIYSRLFGDGYTLSNLKYYFGQNIAQFWLGLIYIVVFVAICSFIYCIVFNIKKCMDSYKEFSAQYQQQNTSKKKKMVH
ncbi:hypothetical protein PCE1_000702 [Barthelona sp. PCE]